MEDAWAGLAGKNGRELLCPPGLHGVWIIRYRRIPRRDSEPLDVPIALGPAGARHNPLDVNASLACVLA